MKVLFLSAAASILVAGPVAAEAPHQTSLTHEGATFSIHYEPRAKTSLRQSGFGPRLPATCLWKAEVSVERTLLDATGRPVAALSRTVGEAKQDHGVQPGYCADIQADQLGVIRDAGKMREFVAAAAERDSRTVQAELASLGKLGHSASR